MEGSICMAAATLQGVLILFEILPLYGPPMGRPSFSEGGGVFYALYFGPLLLGAVDGSSSPIPSTVGLRAGGDTKGGSQEVEGEA
jgi:hypothetical protein